MRSLGDQCSNRLQCYSSLRIVALLTYRIFILPQGAVSLRIHAETVVNPGLAILVQTRRVEFQLTNEIPSRSGACSAPNSELGRVKVAHFSPNRNSCDPRRPYAGSIIVLFEFFYEGQARLVLLNCFLLSSDPPPTPPSSPLFIVFEFQIAM